MTRKKVWSEVHEKLKNTMKNYLETKEGSPLNADTFIDEKKRTFSKIIENNPKWGDSNRSSFFFHDKSLFRFKKSKRQIR